MNKFVTLDGGHVTAVIIYAAFDQTYFEDLKNILLFLNLNVKICLE